jgi:hypothetical protein
VFETGLLKVCCEPDKYTNQARNYHQGRTESPYKGLRFVSTFWMSRLAVPTTGKLDNNTLRSPISNLTQAGETALRPDVRLWLCPAVIVAGNNRAVPWFLIVPCNLCQSPGMHSLNSFKHNAH